MSSVARNAASVAAALVVLLTAGACRSGGSAGPTATPTPAWSPRRRPTRPRWLQRRPAARRRNWAAVVLDPTDYPAEFGVKRQQARLVAPSDVPGLAASASGFFRHQRDSNGSEFVKRRRCRGGCRGRCGCGARGIRARCLPAGADGRRGECHVEARKRDGGSLSGESVLLRRYRHVERGWRASSARDRRCRGRVRARTDVRRNRGRCIRCGAADGGRDAYCDVDRCAPGRCDTVARFLGSTVS